MSLAHRAKGLVSYYRQGGISEVALRLSAYGYLPRTLFSLGACHVFMLGPLNLRALSRPLHGYEIERGAVGVLDELMACQGRRPETSRAFLAGLFDSGRECFVARLAGEIVAYFWAFSGSYRLQFDGDPRHAITIALPERDIFFGNGFIAHAHRLRGLFPHLVNHVAEQHPGARCFSSVLHTNLGSLQAHRRVGFLPLVTLACVSVGPLGIFYRATDRLRPRALLGIGAVTVEIDDFLGESDIARPSGAVQPVPDERRTRPS